MAISGRENFDDNLLHCKHGYSMDKDYVCFFLPLQLIDRVQSGVAGSIGKVYFSTHTEVQDVIRIGQFSLLQQVQHRLF